MGFPAAKLDAGLFVPAREVQELKGVPEWTDINPRFGVAIDVFGNGRTAVKASVGRFNQLTRSDLTRRFHPFSSSVNTAFRNWNDVNGNYIPDCALADFTANGECGAISNQNFGKFIPSATIFDDSVTKDNRDFCGHQRRGRAPDPRRAVGQRRLQPQLGRQLHGDREHAARPEASTILHHVPNDRGCRMPDSSSADTTTSSRRSSGRASCG
jgi:hypothetical protein